MLNVPVSVTGRVNEDGLYLQQEWSKFVGAYLEGWDQGANSITGAG
jgi:hypothetical protein